MQLKVKTIDFSVRIINLYKYLIKEHSEYVLSKQILRCGTNPGAMCREAQNAESKKDFIHKNAVSQKEISETMYWIELLYRTDYIGYTMYKSLLIDAEEIYKMITSTILTAKKRSGER